MRSVRTLAVSFSCLAALLATRHAAAGDWRTFEAGSLIIPMDVAYQNGGMFQAYGLLFQLLRQGVPVSWIIEPTKT